jgi:hypothetical protein
MNLILLSPTDLRLSSELSRSGSVKSFEDRLRSSIEEIGLVEPLKVARQSDGTFLVIDGNLRLRAILAIREKDKARFEKIPAYVIDYDRRFEIRFQSDIYQDLLPSQLATLVEHLHTAESVLKTDIARYIGVSPATLRNYTGLWRLMARGGLFSRVVDLMDVGVLPASNPYAWLRLTDEGLQRVLVERFSKTEDVHLWLEEAVKAARLGQAQRYPIKFVEMVTAALPANCYRHNEDVRAIKRDLGLRRAVAVAGKSATADCAPAIKHLSKVVRHSQDVVLRAAAESLQAYLR